MNRRVFNVLTAVSLVGVPAFASADEDPWSFAASVAGLQRLDDDGGVYRNAEGKRPWVISPSISGSYAASPSTSVWFNVTAFVDPSDTNFSDNGNNEVDTTVGATFTLGNGIDLTPELGYWAAGNGLTGVGAAFVPAITLGRSFPVWAEGVTLTPAVRAEYVRTLEEDGNGARVYPQATLAYEGQVGQVPVTPALRTGIAVAMGESFGLESGAGFFAEPSVRIGITDRVALFAAYKVTMPISGMEDRDTSHAAKLGIELTF